MRQCGSECASVCASVEVSASVGGTNHSHKLLSVCVHGSVRVKVCTRCVCVLERIGVRMSS